MSPREKIDSGKYIMISKVDRNVKNFLVVISILGVIAVGVRKYDLTFDTQEQKQKVINSINEKLEDKPEFYKLEELAKDPQRHMNFQEKKNLIIMNETQKKIEENQVKIGQDLQEIKQLIKNKNQ